MMKDIAKKAYALAVPAAVLGVTWYVTLPILRYTLLMQEQKGVFLLTPDYFRQVFADPWPLTTLISDFLLQFYSNAATGAAITAAIVALVCIMVTHIFRFTSLRQIAGGIAAAAAWLAIAHANTPRTGVIILCLTALCAMVSSFFPYRKADGGGKWWQAAAATAAMVASAAMIVTDRQIKENERWYAVEYAVRCHDWNLVLAIATPEVCRQDMSYVPYSLLALNATGQLGERIFDFPVTGTESFGEADAGNWSSCSLRSIIYETIGCTNEAIHQAFQLGMALDHGTSFGLLRQLIRLELENGDPALAMKYAEILGRSPANRKTAQAAMKMAMEQAATQEETPQRVSGRGKDAMISNNSIYNLGNIILSCESANSAAKERMLCHLLVSGETARFSQALRELYGEEYDLARLPKYFRVTQQARKQLD